MQYCQQTNEIILSALSKQFNAFHQNLNQRDVSSRNTSPVGVTLSEEGIKFEVLDKLICEDVVPHLSASNGGRYWGFVTGGANPVATYADWLVTTFNQNVAKSGDSIASEIEQQTLNWLVELFDLPTCFNGVFTTGATAANLLAAFTARQFIGQQQCIDVAKSGMARLEAQIFSATPHASMVKSLGFAGFGQNNWQKINCIQNTESIDISHLETLLASSNSRGKIVIASAATVTGTDFDDFKAISLLCRDYQAWLHVDAAFGMFDRLISEKGGKTRGIELADSITLDCHKWLNVPYDCGVFLTRHISLLKDSCNVAAPYLANQENTNSFLSLGIENSRRFRAFPVWATLLAYGKKGITDNINSNIRQAKMLADWINQSDKYLLLKPCELNVVLFMPNNLVINLNSEQCIAKLNSTGQVFLTPGEWLGKPIIRAALSNWATSDDDLLHVISILDKLF